MLEQKGQFWNVHEIWHKARVKVPVGTNGPMGTHLLKKNFTVIEKANVSLQCLKKKKKKKL